MQLLRYFVAQTVLFFIVFLLTLNDFNAEATFDEFSPHLQYPLKHRQGDASQLYTITPVDKLF